MAKHFSLLISLFFSSQFLTAQYLPLVAEGKYWVHITYDGADINPGTTEAYLLFMEGDSIVNGQTYKKLWKSHLAGSHPCPTPSYPCFKPDIPYKTISKNLVALLREDVLARKIFHLPTSSLPQHLPFCSTVEYELLDFSLAVGDTLNKCLRTAIGDLPQLGFGKIDSLGVEDFYKKQRKTLYTTGYQTYLGLPPVGQVRVLEGIGFEHFGIFHVSGNRDVLLDFCEGSLAECNIVSDFQEVESNGFFRISPNPSRDFIKIETSKTIEKMRLWDATGKEISTSFESGKLQILGSKTGTYFLQVFFSDGKTTGKWVVVGF